MSSALAIRDDGAMTVQWTPAAVQRREEALDGLAMVARVSTPEENERAVAAQAAAAALRSDTEKARKMMKDPVLEFGRTIDNAARTFIAPVEAELMRVAREVGNYQQQVEAKRKAEEAARLLEQQRMEAERNAEIARVAREEAERVSKLEAAAAEARRKASAEEATKLEAEVKRQKELAQAQTLERMDAIQERFDQEQAALPTIAEPVRAKGQSVTEIVVIDQIREFELVKARPDLVRKVEFDLIGLKRDLANGVKVPGVTWHKETQSTVRRLPAREAITIGG